MPRNHKRASLLLELVFVARRTARHFYEIAVEEWQQVRKECSRINSAVLLSLLAKGRLMPALHAKWEERVSQQESPLFSSSRQYPLLSKVGTHPPGPAAVTPYLYQPTTCYQLPTLARC